MQEGVEGIAHVEGFRWKGQVQKVHDARIKPFGVAPCHHFRRKVRGDYVQSVFLEVHAVLPGART